MGEEAVGDGQSRKGAATFKHFCMGAPSVAATQLGDPGDWYLPPLTVAKRQSTRGHPERGEQWDSYSTSQQVVSCDGMVVGARQHPFRTSS